MVDSTLHDLCKGFGAIISRSKQPGFEEEASICNDRGNLPLHAACSFSANQDVIQTLLMAYPEAASRPNNAGNLPIHQAAMWQAPVETVEILLSRYPDGATKRNQYGSLPLHMAASNQASMEVIQLLIDIYPDALHLQNDDGMTPLDLALADESASESMIALLEGRAPPPELSRRQKADKYLERAEALERKLLSMRQSTGVQGRDLHESIAAVRRLADRFPHALYSAGIDPNELEISLSNALADEADMGVARPPSSGKLSDAELVILDFVKKRAITRSKNQLSSNGMHPSSTAPRPRDRIEELLSTIVGLDHVKSQVRGLRRTAEICDLRESLVPPTMSQTRGASSNQAMILPIISDDNLRPKASHMVFIGNPGTGKTAVARLLAKAYHELDILRKPKFLEVERMDLVGRTPQHTLSKTNEVLEEAAGGILLIDEAFTLGMPSKRSKPDAGMDAINHLIRSIDEAQRDSKNDVHPMIILCGFPLEMHSFLTAQQNFRKRFSLTYEFPDYTCLELAQIFVELCQSKGFDLESSLTVYVISDLLKRETTAAWRAERNGRICELLLAGARAEVRKRMRRANFEETEDIDPQLIFRSDIETVMKEEFK